MKVKSLIILAVVMLFLGVVAFGGGYLFKSLDEDNFVATEKSNSIIKETDDPLDENDSAKDDCVDRGHPCEKHIECFTDSEYQEAVKECEEAEENKEDTLDEEAEDDEGNNDEEEEIIEEDVTEEGLVAYYPFDEDIKDYSGNDIDATNHNAYFVDGKKDKALKFSDKSNSYIHVPIDINSSSLPQMTMALWVKAEKGGVVVRHIIGNGNDEYNRALLTDFRGGGKGWSCFAGDGMVLGYEPVVADKWTFIAAVYDQDAGTVKLFVDGSVYEKEGKMVDEGTSFILIGAQGSEEANSHHFKGTIDEVKIYDYALSETELNSLYKTGIAKPKIDN